MKEYFSGRGWSMVTIVTRLCFLFAAFSLTGTSVMAAEAVWPEGKFSSVEVSGPGCDSVFAVETYFAQHFLMGPTRRTSVIHLRDRVTDRKSVV